MAGAVALVLAAGLGGCARDDDGATAVGNRPPATPAPASAVPLPSPLPITKELSRSGAQEFAKYWIATLNYAMTSGDVDPLRAASDPTCTVCIEAVSTVRAGYLDGGWVQGGTYTVRSVNAEEFGLDDRPVLAMFLDRNARSGYAGDGSLRDSAPAASFIACEVTLEWVASGWRTRGINGDILPVT
jgi:hypothetical protein